ncbi:MAG: arginine repressor [Bryobacterales bacterium]|nr:arginine repressor [Bryobacterales bacterium]
MTKNYRQGQILKLIRTRQVHTQEELARELRGQGIETTQVTLSRDIREMGIVKTSDGYRELVRDTSGPSLDTVLKEFLLDVRIAQNLVVLKTFIGNANAIAVALDSEDWAEITGTVAGDDTILIVCWDDSRAKTVYERLTRYVNE